MATEVNCDPCSEEDKSSPAIRYCCECEEKLCKECGEYHSRFKAFKSHHLIDLKSTGFKVAPSSKKYCEVHPDAVLDFYCTQHDVACCGACIPKAHRNCDTVLPLDFASKNVHHSSLLTETLADINSLTDTVKKLIQNRNANLKSLEQTKALISQQINTVKSRLIKHIDELTSKLLKQLTSIQRKHESKIKKQKEEMAKFKSDLERNTDELQFFKSHGSNNQLFLSLRQMVSRNQKLEIDLQRLLSSSDEIVIEFDEVSQSALEKIGLISEHTKPCTVQYKSRKLLQAQFQPDVINSPSVFEKSGLIKLKSDVNYNVTDIAITSSNKLLLSNYNGDYPKVYIYRDCKNYENEIQCSRPPYGITVIPDTDTAVVTLPSEGSIQFINTTNMTKGDKVPLGVWFWGITATKDNIIVGGEGVVYILDRHGSCGSKINMIKEVTVKDESGINSIHYDKVNDRLLCRYDGGMCCVTLDSKIVYQYKVSGEAGLVVDQQGHVYLSHTPNEIHRLSSDGNFRDVILAQSHGINNPNALTFNKNFTKLFVVNESKTAVSMFSCK